MYRHKKSFSYRSYVKTIFLLTIEKNNHILQEWNTLIQREAPATGFIEDDKVTIKYDNNFSYSLCFARTNKMDGSFNMSFVASLRPGLLVDFHVRDILKNLAVPLWC